MSLVQINSRPSSPMPKHIAFFSLGFRPFFMGASIFSVLSMLVWMGIYFSWITIDLQTISPSQWHAHEMVYGYSMAVIAGFLLTAVENWTGRPTLRGTPLACLASSWLLARVFFLLGHTFFLAAAIADLVFMAALFAALARPILKTRQWKQVGVLSKVALLFVGNCFFYSAALAYTPNTLSSALYGGVYLVIGLILTIAGRVFPNFIQNLVAEDVVLRNPRSLGILSLALFVVFFVNQLFYFNPSVLFWSSLLLAAVTTTRLVLWHCAGIWKVPLLWSMYLSLAFIDLGFILFAFSASQGALVLFAVHAFTVGGIGLVTMSMMARVTLGHTGRSVRRLTPGATWCFFALLVGACLRVVLPLMFPSNYAAWIFLSQCCWIGAFAFFAVIHFRILLEQDVTRK